MSTLGGNDSDNFMSGFGESGNRSFQRPGMKTPVKKALETSEENPFKVPTVSKNGKLWNYFF